MQAKKIISMAIAAAFLWSAPLASAWADDLPTYVISCLGDGLTENKWPSKLQELLEEHGTAHFEVYDYGAYNKSPFDFYGWNHWMEHSPDIYLIMLGSTDLYWYWVEHNLIETWVNNTVGWLQRLINKAYESSAGAPYIILSAIPPMSEGILTYWVNEYNHKISGLNNVDMWITSNWDSFYDADNGVPKAGMIINYYYTTDEGYDIIAENFYNAIIQLVGEGDIYQFVDRPKDSNYY